MTMNILIRSILIAGLTPVMLLAQDPPSPAPAEPASAPAPYLASGPRELFERAVALAERGAAQQARTLFKALTLAYPELPEPHINLAVLLANAGEVEAAADELEAAMHAHPVCQAALDLEFQRQIGLYSAALLARGAPASLPAAPAPVAAAPPSSSVAPPPVPAVASPAPPPPPAIAGEVRVVTQAADPCLNFRPQPSSSSAALECLPPGTPVRWLETAGDWSRVSLRDGRVGWMGASFLAAPGS